MPMEACSSRSEKKSTCTGSAVIRDLSEPPACTDVSEGQWAGRERPSGSSQVRGRPWTHYDDSPFCSSLSHSL